MRVVMFQSRTSVMRTAVAIAILLVTGASAAAQERLFGIFNDRLTELDTVPGRLGRPLVSIPFRRDTPLFPVAGGRFLAYSRTVPGELVPSITELVDLRTGRITGVLPGVDAVVFASDPRVPRLYLRNIDRLIVADLPQMTTRSFTFAYGEFPPIVAYSPTGPIAVQRIGAAITALDLTTGATRSFPTVTGSTEDLVVDDAGSRAYLTTREGIFAYDLASGAQVASNTALRPPTTGNRFQVRLDPSRNRVLVLHDPAWFDAMPALVGVLNAGTLAVEAIVPVPTLAGLPPQPVPFRAFSTPAQFEYSARRDTLYLASSQVIHTSPGGIEEPQPCRVATLSRLNAASGATIERSDVTTLARATAGLGGSLCYASLIVVRAPEPPIASGVTMSRAVDITWTDPGNVTHFEVEAGTAPGQRDIAVFQVVGTRLLVQRVPPGAYHVRVRAINDVGRSLPSNDVTIVVP